MAQTELSALVVKLEADLRGFRADMSAGQKMVADQSAKMAASLEKMNQDGTKSAFSLSGVLNTAIGVGLVDMVKSATSMLVGLGTTLFNTFVTEGVAAASEQEDAIQRLNQSLSASGKYSAQASADLVAYASALQATTKYGDETIIGTMGLIQSLGQLDQDGLKLATKAAMDLSAALGIDLNTAAMLVGKAAAGETGTLGRYGIKIEEGATKAETFARALDGINAKFGGAATAAVNTYSGALTQAKNSFSDIQEETGSLLTENAALITVIKEGNRLFQDAAKYVKDHKTELQGMVKDGIVAAIRATQVLVLAFDEFRMMGKRSFAEVAAPVRDLTALLMALGPAAALNFKEAGRILDQAAKKTGESYADANKSSEAVKAISDALMQLEQAAIRGGAGQDALNRSLAGQSAAAEGAKGKVDALTDAQKKLVEEGTKISQGLTSQDPKIKYDAELEALIASNEAKAITDDEYNAAMLSRLEIRDAAIKEMDLKKASDYQAQIDTLTALDEDANARAIQSNRAKLDAMLKDQTVAQAVKDKIREDDKKREDLKNSQQLSAAASMLGGITQLIQGKSKEAFIVNKAAALAETTIRGVQAVQAALASAPPPFNIGLAVTQGALAAANVAKIMSTNLAHGIDAVPGIGRRDNFPAMLSPGERVVPRETNKDLKGLISSNEQVPSLLQAMIARLDRMDPSVVVNVGGREILDAVNDQIIRGRRLATT